MKIKCTCCKHKFEVEITDKGIPKTYVCPACREKHRERKGKNG